MIDQSNPYFKQAELVVSVLPPITKYDCFALKGGTAINLFVQNMPRLSVDIDLTYLPVEPREKSLMRIGISQVETLPAVRWKLMNIQKIDKDKKREYLDKLRKSFT